MVNNRKELRIIDGVVMLNNADGDFVAMESIIESLITDALWLRIQFYFKKKIFILRCWQDGQVPYFTEIVDTQDYLMLSTGDGFSTVQEAITDGMRRFAKKAVAEEERLLMIA